MANNPIQASDLIDSGAIDKIIKDFERLKTVTDEIAKSIKSDVKKSVEDLSKTKITPQNFTQIVKLISDLERKNKILNETLKEQSRINKDLQKAQNQKLSTSKAEAKANDDLIKSIKVEEAEKLKLLKIEQQEEKLKREKIATSKVEAKATEDEAKAAERARIANERLNNAYFQASKRLNDLKNKYRDLVLRGKENEAETKRLKQEMADLDKTLKKVDADAGVFIREVGNYKEKIREALSETGLFDGKLQRMATSLKKIQANLKESAEQQGKFTTAMKFGGAALLGLAAAGVAYLLSIKDKAGEISELARKAAEDFNIYTRKAEIGAAAAAGSLKGFETSVTKASEALYNLNRTLAAYEKGLISLDEAQQKINLDLEDQKEIANDATIGLKERREALNASFVLEKEAAQLNLSAKKTILERVIAEREAAEFASGKGQANIKFYKAESEALKEVNAAIDAQGDLLRTQAQAQRQKNIEEAITEIELLRSKKLAADGKEELLKKEIEDIEKSIDKRAELSNELFQQQKATTEEEIKIFKEKLGVQFDEAKLLSQTDPIKLKNQLESIKQLNEEGKLIGLGTQSIEELAKIVKQYQDNRIANQQKINDLEKEELKETQKIIEIRRSIVIANQKNIADLREKDFEDAQNSVERNFDILLEKENTYNRKKLTARKNAIDNETQKRKDLLNAQLELLRLENEKEKEAINNSADTEKIKAEKLLEINNQYLIDKNKLYADNQAETLKRDTEIIEQEKAIRKKQLQIAADYANQAADILDNALQKSINKNEEAFNKQLERRNKEIERQQELQEKGLKNELAKQEAIRAQEEIKREEQKQKEKRQQQYIAFLRLVSGYAEKDPDTAVRKALLDIAQIKASEVLFAATGAENIKGPGTSTSDSIPARLSKGESVLTAKGTKEFTGLATAINKGNGEAWMYDYFKNNYLPNFLKEAGILMPKGESTSTLENEVKAVAKEIQALRSIVANKKESHYNIDQLGNIVAKEIENGIARTTTYIRQRPRF